ncbi:MAG: hypothetical protein GF400_00685 [Candidatus Eisenbacteria bacterium]|nr:hypothetical protein [Candidatus Eisenbacteria bacterium]
MELSMRGIGLAFLCMLVLSLASPSLSAAVETLTLDAAVQMALERNLSLEASRENYESAKWGLRASRAALLPSVSLSSTARRVDPETYERANASLDFAEEFGVEVEPFLYETTYETSFRADLPIWNGGKLWGAAGVAEGARDAALSSYESARRGIVVEAKSAYFGLLRALELLGVQEEAVLAAERNAEAARRRLEVGMANRAEHLRWESQLARERGALVDAEAGVTLARTRLLNVLGLSLDTEVSLDGVPEGMLEEARARYEGLRGDGPLTEERALELLRGSPDLESLRASTDIGRSRVTIARGAFLPALNASGSYGWKADDDIEPDDETAWSVTLALELPVFTSFRNFSQYHESKRAYFASLRREEDGRRAMVAALRSADSTVGSSLKRLTAARVEEERAAELLKNVRNMHAQGMATYTELLDAEVLYGRSRVGTVNALFDCLLALADAERLLGPEPDAHGAGG